MKARFQTIAEQVATRLREEMFRGRWGETLPGLRPLSEELGVDPKTIQVALRQLEREGILKSEGPRRSRRITLREQKTSSSLKVGIMTYQPADKGLPVVMDIRHRFLEAGHLPFFPARSLAELAMDPARVATLVSKEEADAWLVFSCSQPVLRWFSQQQAATFAFFGSMRGQPVAGTGPDMREAFRMATRRLLSLGHRRIVFLTDAPFSHAEPGLFGGALLEELEAANITTGPYNLCRWDGSPEGLRAEVGKLFATTPPTALIIDGALPFLTVQQYLASRGIHSPDRVSLICTEADRAFDWQEPKVAHIKWSTERMIRRVIRWADHVASGKTDQRKTFTKAKFIDGGTVSPAPKPARHVKGV